MIELLSQVNYWHWLALGLLLLCGELLGTAVYVVAWYLRDAGWYRAGVCSYQLAATMGELWCILSRTHLALVA